MKKIFALFAVAAMSVFSAVAGTWDLNANLMMRKNGEVELENSAKFDVDDGKGFQGIFTKFFGDSSLVDFGFNVTLGYDDYKSGSDTVKNTYFAFGPAVKFNLNENFVLFGTAGYLVEFMTYKISDSSMLNYGFDVNLGARLYFNEFIGVNAGIDYCVIKGGSAESGSSTPSIDVTDGSDIKYYAGIAFRLGN